MGDDGAEALAACIRTNHVIRTLEAAHCRIGSRGADYLADALVENDTLQALLVRSAMGRFTFFGDDSAIGKVYVADVGLSDSARVDLVI